MNTLSGYTEVDLNGELIPFKFGTNAWALFCEKRKIEFYQIAESGVFGKIEGDKVLSPDVFALIELFYFAYVSAIRAKKETVKLNIEQFTELVDETPGVMVKLQEVMLQAKIMGYTFIELAREGEKGNFQKT